MAPTDEPRLITPISQRPFELYALSLERGPNFAPAHIFSAYQAARGNMSGCILLDPEQVTFSSIALRRRVNHGWIKVAEGGPYSPPRPHSTASASRFRWNPFRQAPSAVRSC